MSFILVYIWTLKKRIDSSLLEGMCDKIFGLTLWAQYCTYGCNGYIYVTRETTKSRSLIRTLYQQIGRDCRLKVYHHHHLTIFDSTTNINRLRQLINQIQWFGENMILVVIYDLVVLVHNDQLIQFNRDADCQGYMAWIESAMFDRTFEENIQIHKLMRYLNQCIYGRWDARCFRTHRVTRCSATRSLELNILHILMP